MTATPTTPQPQPTQPVPQPRPSSPWGNPTGVPPVPNYAPGDHTSALGDLRGIHLALSAHLASHDCGPRCPDVAYLLGEAAAVLAHTDPTRRTWLRAVA